MNMSALARDMAPPVAVKERMGGNECGSPWTTMDKETEDVARFFWELVSETATEMKVGIGAH
jgi:hypothetical protein